MDKLKDYRKNTSLDYKELKYDIRNKNISRELLKDLCNDEKYKAAKHRRLEISRNLIRIRKDYINQFDNGNITRAQGTLIMEILDIVYSFSAL